MSHQMETGSERYRADQDGLPQGVITVEQEGQDIAPIEELFEEGTLGKSNLDGTNDNQITQIDNPIRRIGRPEEKGLPERKIAIRHLC